MYDVIIIGAGPAGLTAGIYASRARLKTLIIEKGMEGGQMINTMDVENYPGIIEGETGMELGMRIGEQVRSFGAEIITDQVIETDLEGPVKKVVCSAGTYEGKTVILAVGAKPKMMDVPGEEEFTGKGVSYCATCDAAFYQDADVFVVGGGDSAVEEALFITRFARKVTIIHRRDQLRAAKILQEKAMANEKIHFLWDTVVEEVKGDKMANALVVKNVKTGEQTTLTSTGDLPFIGIFVFIGYSPDTSMFDEKLQRDPAGYLVADGDMRSNLPGVFVAGDIRNKKIRQVVTATADGAVAAMMAEKYVE